MKTFRNCFLFIPILVVLTDAARGNDIISSGDTWAYFKGIEAPPADWNQVSFDDGLWFQSETPIGYGPVGSQEAARIRTSIDDMQGQYRTIFLRKIFMIEDAAAESGLTVTVDWDDGFVAYLNGEEIAFQNMREVDRPFTYNTGARPGRESGGDLFQLSIPTTSLVDGRNVLAFSVHNNVLNSNDLFFDVSLRRTGATFVRGDADLSGRINLFDAFLSLHHVFLGTELSCLDAADANDDGSVNSADPSYLLNHLFLRGDPIPAPFPDAGFDDTLDDLGCAPL